MLEPLISTRKVIVDHPQKEGEEDQAKGEEEVANVEDSDELKLGLIMLLLCVLIHAIHL